MTNPLYRSLYWRIALGFVLCIATVLSLQACVVFALLYRTQAAGERLTQSASMALAQAIDSGANDLQALLSQRYPAPSQSLLAVLGSGQVLTAGRTVAPNAQIRGAMRELAKRPVRALPREWLGEPYHSAPIVVRGEIVGAVAVVPETWVERLGPALLASGIGLLLVGTALSSIFIFGPAHKRLNELESAALDLGAGDLTVRACDTGGDEVARVARAFNRMAADLAASDAARRLLLADVSHELMTPLTAIRGYQERAVVDPAVQQSPLLAKSLAVIGDETQRVERIVGDLLDLAKLEGGADALEMADVSVEGLFGRVAARHAPQAAAKSLTLTTTVGPGAEVLYGDRFRLEQALQNLTANAVRHAREGGRVHISAEVREGGTVLSVADNGPGIAKEHLKLVFDRFYKVDAARSGDSSGSGLGLSIVRAIVERHGGTVTVTSDAHVKTTFTIWLPSPDLAALS